MLTQNFDNLDDAAKWVYTTYQQWIFAYRAVIKLILEDDDTIKKLWKHYEPFKIPKTIEDIDIVALLGMVDAVCSGDIKKAAHHACYLYTVQEKANDALNRGDLEGINQVFYSWITFMDKEFTI